MPRRPIQLERTGMRTPRERMWAAILRLTTFSAAQIEDAAHPASRRATQSYLQALMKAGYVLAQPHERFQTATYELVKPQQQPPRLTRSGEASKAALGVLAMWRAMKVRKVFDADQIAADATQGGVTCSRCTAKAYIGALARAGYLRVDVQAVPGRLARMRLVRDTGPQPPAVTRARAVFDRNTGQLHVTETAQEVGDGLAA
ncbi:MAG: hypothetical protein QM702_04365 [Rubrivivax sp.]